MANSDNYSYHIDAGGETEIDPLEYKIAILHYRFGYDENDLRQRNPDDIDSLFKKLTESGE